MLKTIHAEEYMGQTVKEIFDNIEMEAVGYANVRISFPDWCLYDNSLKVVNKWCWLHLEELGGFDLNVHEYEWSKEA